MPTRGAYPGIGKLATTDLETVPTTGATLTAFKALSGMTNAGKYSFAAVNASGDEVTVCFPVLLDA